MKLAISVRLEDREELDRRLKSKTTSVRNRQRAQIVLLAADGLPKNKIAEAIEVSRVTVGKWCERYVTQGIDGLSDAPGRGRKQSLPDEKIQRSLEEVGKPPKYLGRWSCRSMAKATGMSKNSVQRLWAANDIKPHVSRTQTGSSWMNLVERKAFICTINQVSCHIFLGKSPESQSLNDTLGGSKVALES